MNLETYQQLWQSQQASQVEEPYSTNPLTVPASVQKQLTYFDKEQRPGQALGGIFSSLMIAICMGVLAGEHKILGLVAGMGGMASLFYTYVYFVMKQNPIRPDEDLHSYLQKSLKKVSLHARGLQLAGLGGGAFMGGMGIYLLSQYQSGELSGKEFGGLLATLIIFGGIAAMLLWWYRNQHPYRSVELRKRLAELLEEFNS
ncbi:MAG: hypothetical protein AAF587_20290 [Bacteroidota bacterium]